MGGVLVAVPQPRATNVVPLDRSLARAVRNLLDTGAKRLSDGARELDRALSIVVDDVDRTVQASRAAVRAAVRAGKLAFEQERRRELVRGPVGLVAGYKPSNNP
jgi:hypothetical protein